MSTPITTIAWRHGDTQAAFGLDALPLVIGTVSAANIRIAGPGGQTLAQIDVIDGRPFVQPIMRPSPLALDGTVLDGSRTLSDGQTLSAHGVEIDVRIDGASLQLVQHSRASLFETLPPVVEREDDDSPIVAEEWRPTAGAQPARRGRRWVMPVIGSVLAVMAFVVFWLTTSVALRLETTPATPGAVFIEGSGPAIRVGDRWLLRRGVHRFVLQSPGYVDLDQRIDIDGSTTTLVLEQQPLPGQLEVRTDATREGTGTVTLVDGDGNQYETEAPALFEGLLPGTYEVTVAQPGYLEWTDLVSVTGLTRTQQLEIDLVPDYARVAIETIPAGASVSSLDTNTTLAEATPATVELPDGRQKVLIALDGYKPVERTYRVFANSAVEAAPITLEPADAQLTVTSRPAGASVTLDGRYQGRTPITLALEPDEQYELRLTRQGFAPQSRRVALPSATQRRMSFELDARNGDVTVRAVPADAEILVNGRVVGSGTAQVSLPAIPQRITVRKPGYIEQERTVTPRPGFTQTVDVRLQTAEAARLASIPQRIEVANDHALRYFRGGTFQRGTSRREPDRRANETLVDVRITKPFYLGVTEVTNAQFAAFRAAHDRRGDVYAALAGDNNPVVNVSWQDAAAYCNWLSQKEGLQPAYIGEFGSLVAVVPATNGYRLPSEAEWVWAARYAGRTGSPRRFGWGANMPPADKSANLADETASDLVRNVLIDYRDGFPATAPVGSFAPNAAGVYDLDGNVAEWIHDYYASSPDTDGPQIDSFGPEKGTDHVIRGPGWRDANVQRVRLAYRGFGKDPEVDIGFRIVRFADR
ncbi:MAG: SUMF1/EgtB/PvdO family nonheme iron enzyme [Pseudomonadota bacterium]